MLRTRCGAALVTALLLAACQERLASPADCPNLCPGSFDIRDTVLYALDEGDSTFTGYLRAGQGSSLRVSAGLPVSEDRAIIRFSSRPDSFLVSGSFRGFTIDSVNLELSLVFRDTTVSGVKLFVYRLPSTVDTNTTFAEVNAAFVPSALIDSFVVDDSLPIPHRFVATLRGADLAKVAISPADSGVLAFGVAMSAGAPTGVRIGGASAGSSGPTFRSFIQVADTSDTTFARTLTPSVRFNTFVSQAPTVLDPALLAIGGVPTSSRSIIRFPWPALLRDSAQLVRATLELVPAGPIAGLPTDSSFVVVRPVLADLGGKSSTASDAAFAASAPAMAGDTDTLGMEVRRAILLWQGETGLPPMFMVQLFPEASSYTVARFGSSRSPQALRPRLRVTYTLTFPFGNP